VKVVFAAQPIGIESGPRLPTEFRLFAFGENATSKGIFVLDRAGAAAVMAAYADHGVELAIDYEHQTFAAGDNGKPAPAAGWFAPEVRADGLWATKVRWTEPAAEMLRRKEYRYFSSTKRTASRGSCRSR
jgi:phage I-like protein